LAIHHDAEVPGFGPVCELTVAALPGHVPLLADALAACEGMVVNVEIKNAPGDAGYDPGQAVAALTAAAIDDAGWTDRVIVSSFQPETLVAVGAANPSLALGALWSPIADGDPWAGLDRAATAGWRAVHPFVSIVTPELVEAAHVRGLAVNVWTVNSTDDMLALVAMGADALITDRLGDALAVARAGEVEEGV
jgi:glycerophosphoryl diester phosphodiesterase